MIGCYGEQDALRPPDPEPVIFVETDWSWDDEITGVDDSMWARIMAYGELQTRPERCQGIFTEATGVSPTQPNLSYLD